MRLAARLTEAVALFILLGLVALSAFHPLYAVDFFWHLELGEMIAQSHAIPDRDSFSAALPDRAYVQFNWLWELGAAWLVDAFGLHAIRVAQALLMAASFAGLYRVARLRLELPELALACTALAFVLFEDRFQERPASLVLGFVVALSPWLMGSGRELTVRSVLSLACLGVLWSNLHGGESLLLPLSLLALGVGEVINRAVLGRESRHVRTEFALLAVSIAALASSPTLLHGLSSWTGTIGAQVRAGNEEWQPTYTMLAHGLRPAFAIIALTPMVVTVAFVWHHWRRYRVGGKSVLDAGELLVCAGYLVLAQQAVRNAFLCLVPLLFMAQRWQAWPGARLRMTRTACALAAAGLLAIAAEDALAYSYGGVRRLPELMRFDLLPDAFPELAADFMSEAGLEGGVINDGRFGGYLIWRLWPRCRVFADSRHHFTEEMWSIFIDTHDALRRPAGLERAFAQFGTELMVFRGPTFPLGVPPEFRLLYKAGDQEVYQDLRGRHAETNLERTRDWLARQGLTVPEDARSLALPALATRLGGRRFLATPFVQLQRRESLEQLQRGDRRAAGAAHRTLAGLQYRAGDYAAAMPEFERAMALAPEDGVLHYQAAQNAFALGDYVGAQPWFRAALERPQGLSAKQLRRLHVLLAVAQRRSQQRQASTP